MSRSTFILLVSVYGFLLGFTMLFLPSQALSYFGRDPDDVYLCSAFRFFGALHIAYNIKRSLRHN